MIFSGPYITMIDSLNRLVNRGSTWVKFLRIHTNDRMREKKSKFFFSGRFFFFADRPTRFFGRPATRNKLFPKVALKAQGDDSPPLLDAKIYHLRKLIWNLIWLLWLLTIRVFLSHTHIFIIQAVEYYAEWMVSPDNTVFKKVINGEDQLLFL